jgi:hypothetical protein
MAFENLGVGGHLVFDETGGLRGMRRASAGLNQLSGSFERFSAQLSNANMVGLALGGIGVAGFGMMAHGAVSARAEVEDLQIILASTIQLTNKQFSQMGTFANEAGTAMGEAHRQMEMIELAAAAAPGETRDLLNIYKAVLGPLTAAGQSAEKIVDLTQGAAIASQALGIDFQNMAFGMGKLISGQVQSDDMLFRMLRSQKLITQSAEEWKALPQAERLKKINELMDKYRANADLIGSTWSAMTGTIASVVKMLGGAFVSPLFDAMKETLNPIVEMFLGASNASSDARRAIMGHWKEVARSAGETLVPIFRYVIDVLRGVFDWGVQVFGALRRAWQWVTEAAEQAGLAGEGGRRFTVILGQIIVAAGILVPALALLKTVLSPLVGLFGLVTGAAGGLLTVITALFSPLGLVLALAGGIAYGVFKGFQREGETLGQTIRRAIDEYIIPAWQKFAAWIEHVWTEYLQPFWKGFKEAVLENISEAIQPLRNAWDDLKRSFILMFDAMGAAFDGGRNDAVSWGRIVGAAFTAVVQAVATLISWFMKLIAVANFVAAHIGYAFKVAGTYIGETFGMVYLAIKNAFSALYNVITAPLRAVMETFAEWVGFLGQTSYGKKILGQMGLGDIDSRSLSMILKNATPQKKDFDTMAGYSSLSDLGESPTERSLRLQLERAEAMSKKKTDQKAMEFEPLEITLNDKRCVEVNTKMNIDKSEIAAAHARHQIEVQERTGASTPPWQRRRLVTRAQQ